MGGKSDFFKNKWLDFEFRGQTFVPPVTYYIALIRVDGTEVSGPVGTTGYQRQAVANTSSQWYSTQGDTTVPSSGSGGRISNVNPISFGVPTTNWALSSNQVVKFRLYDALTGGNYYREGTLATPLTISSGDSPLSFPSNALAIYEV